MAGATAGEDLLFRPAAANEADLLTALALRSKAYWGYPPTFLAACEEELRVAASGIMAGPVTYTVAEKDSRVVGYYGVRPDTPERWELEALFVEPAHIGTGIGGALIRHALDAIAARGARTLVVQGDPNAEGFYRAAGGQAVGHSESGSVPGRFLPVFEIQVGGPPERPST